MTRGWRFRRVIFIFERYQLHADLNINNNFFKTEQLSPSQSVYVLRSVKRIINNIILLKLELREHFHKRIRHVERIV